MADKNKTPVNLENLETFLTQCKQIFFQKEDDIASSILNATSGYKSITAGDDLLDVLGKMYYSFEEYEKEIDVSISNMDLATYTVKIDLEDSNPLTCITYLDDAKNMTKGSSDWDSKPIFKDIKPCVLKNGEVNYYLNPNNFNYRIGGEASDLTGIDGDVMIEFKKFAYKIYKQSNALYVSISNDPKIIEANDYHYYAFSKEKEGDRNYFYYGAYKGSLDDNGKLRSLINKIVASNKTISAFTSAANLNGDGYTITSFFQLVALQCLYLIRFGSLNGQTALGSGITGRSNASTDANYGPIPTGGVEDQGMYYGSTSNNGSSSDLSQAKLGHVKFAGIEDFWGNIWEWIGNFRTDANRQVITNIGTKEFTFTTGLTSNVSGWVKDVAGTSEAGFIGITHGGSNSTYFCDNGVLYAFCVLVFGGRWDYGANAGPFDLNADSGSGAAYGSIGARLLYL